MIPGPAIAKVLASAASMAAAQLFSTALGAAIKPDERRVIYYANRTLPNLIPETGTLFDLYWRGFLTDAELGTWLREQGARWQPPSAGERNATLWWGAGNFLRPNPGPELLRARYLMGDLSKDAAQSILRTWAGWQPEYAAWFLDQRDPFPIDWSVAQFHMGRLNAAQLARELDQNGMVGADRQQQFIHSSLPFSPVDVLTLRNRDWIDDAAMVANLKGSGLRSEDAAHMYGRLRHYVPGVSDIIRFSVREVWNNEVVQRFRYDEELPADYEYWARKSGLDYDVQREFPDSGEAGALKWSRAYWRAHWEVPSPTQSYQMLHRLRPDNIAQWRTLFPNIEPFTLGDVNNILKVADYAPGVRDQLTAISYHPLTRTDVRRMYRLGVLTKEQATSAFRDVGYTEADARHLANFTEADLKTTRLRKTRNRVARQLESAYRLGVLDDDQFARQYYNLLDRPAAEQREFDNLDPAGQASLARVNTEVGAILNSLKAEIAVERVKEVVKGIKRSFLQGDLAEVDAQHHLAVAGVSTEAAARLLDTWRMLMETRYRSLSTSQIIRSYESGIATADEAAARLRRLGWQETDLRWLLEMAGERLSIAEARAAKAMARTVAERQRAQVRELQATEREQKRRRAELAKTATPQQLQRWYKKCLIKRSDAYRRLLDLGKNPEDIERMLNEAEGDRKEPCPPWTAG